MKYFMILLRTVAGVVLLVFGFNGFLNFYPLPETTAEAKAFQDALWASGPIMYLEKAIEVIVGLSFLMNKFIPATALVFLPVSLNIMMVDVLLQPQYWFMGGTLFILNVILILQHRNVYKPIIGYN